MTSKTVARIILAVLTVILLIASATVQVRPNPGSMLFGGPEMLLGLVILNGLALVAIVVGIGAAAVGVGLLFLLAFGDES